MFRKSGLILYNEYIKIIFLPLYNPVCQTKELTN